MDLNNIQVRSLCVLCLIHINMSLDNESKTFSPFFTPVQVILQILAGIVALEPENRKC